MANCIRSDMGAVSVLWKLEEAGKLELIAAIEQNEYM
jgi:hypothetical protein